MFITSHMIHRAVFCGDPAQRKSMSGICALLNISEQWRIPNSIPISLYSNTLIVYLSLFKSKIKTKMPCFPPFLCHDIQFLSAVGSVALYHTSTVTETHRGCVWHCRLALQLAASHGALGNSNSISLPTHWAGRCVRPDTESAQTLNLVGATGLRLGWVILLKAQRIGRLCGVADKDVGGGRVGEGSKKHGYYTSLSLSLSFFF